MKPIFVFGIGHSGTTLCASILGSHKEVDLITFETGLLLDLRNFRQAAIELQRLWLGSGKKRLVEKTPGHLARSKEIATFFPQADLVCTIRNPLDIYASLLSRSESHDYSLERVRQGLVETIQAREVGAYIFNYEELIQFPERSVRRLCGAVGLQFESQMLSPWKNEFSWFGIKEPIRPSDVKEKGGGHLMNRAWQLRQPFFDGRNRWVRELSAETSKEVAKALHPNAIKLGYDLPSLWRAHVDVMKNDSTLNDSRP